MTYLPLDLKFLVLNYIPPLKLIKLLQQLNVNYLNQYYYTYSFIYNTYENKIIYP